MHSGLTAGTSFPQSCQPRMRDRLPPAGLPALAQGRFNLTRSPAYLLDIARILMQQPGNRRPQRQEQQERAAAQRAPLKPHGCFLTVALRASA